MCLVVLFFINKLCSYSFSQFLFVLFQANEINKWPGAPSDKPHKIKRAARTAPAGERISGREGETTHPPAQGAPGKTQDQQRRGNNIGNLYCKVPILNALFNNDFTFKNLSCMSLHAISVFDKVWKWSPEKKCTSKAPLSSSKKWK